MLSNQYTKPLILAIKTYTKTDGEIKSENACTLVMNVCEDVSS